MKPLARFLSRISFLTVFRTATASRVATALAVFSPAFLPARLPASQPLPAAAVEVLDPLPPAIAFLPDANPYRPLLAQLHRLPAAQADSLNTWLRAAERDPALVPDEQTASFLREIAGVVATIPPPAPDTELWPVYPPADASGAPDTISTPPFQLLRQLSQLTRIGSRQLPPDEAAAACVGLARLGRSLRTGEGAIVHQMIGVLLEDQSRLAIAARFNDFSADSLGRLLDLWDALPPAREGLAMFDGELVFLETSLRRELLPALKSLKAGLAAADSAPGDADAPPATFTLGLRLSGIADLGGGEVWISFENELTGQRFRLRNGESVEGFSLVSVDFANGRARLRHAEGEAVLDLRAKRIVELHSLARLKETFAALVGDDEASAFLDNMLREVHARPDGAEGYLRSILADTERAIAHAVAAARTARRDDIQPWPDLEQSNPFTKMACEGYPMLTRSFLEKNTAEQMFVSALRLRRAALGGPSAQPSADPFGEASAPFAYEETEDGGFLLHSAFETRSGAPLSYKFGPPDASRQ